MQTEDTWPNHMWIVNKAHKKMQKESKVFKQHSLNCTPSPEEWIKIGREKKNTEKKPWTSLDEFVLLKWIY